MRAVTLTIAITVVALVTASSAHAVCTLVGTTVTCTGTTINQNPPDGYGTVTQSGLTINVDPSATVQGSNNGINVGASNTINNSGLIQVTGSGGGVKLGANGTVSNSGTIEGTVGVLTTGGNIAVTNSGTITGTGGAFVPAIQFSSGGNTLTLTPSSVINSFVTASATDALQLGGTGSGSFDVGLIGSGQQYRGFGLYQKVGTSTWTLSGTGTQNWTISQGTLVGDTSSLQGKITNNAALVFDQASNGTYASTVSGTGSLTKQNTGTVTFTGTNAYSGGTTISAGTLQLGNGGAGGSIAGDVTDNATLSFNRSDSYSFSGTISGTGSVEQNGTGSTTLTATEAYTGATTVNAGTLLVNGSISTSSGLTVNTGGTVGGTGTLPTTVISGGTLAPGNSIGTVTVQGSLSFSPTSTYLVEISPTANDRTNVTGTATLDGTVNVIPQAGSYALGTTYTLLNATGGLIGTFSGLTIQSPFICACLSYDANNVYFTFVPSGLSFAGVGQTPNQIATGAAVERLGTGNPIYDVVILGSAAHARAAFDLLSGEVHASVPGVILYDSRYVRDALIGRMRQSYGSKSNQFAALEAGGPLVASIGHAPTPPYALGYGQDKQAPYAGGMPGNGQLDSWGQSLGAWGDLDSNGNAATLQRSLGGIITGLDATFDDHWRLGLAAGYTQSSLDVSARLSSGSVDAYHLALYGGGQLGALGLRTGAAYSWNGIETTRNVTFSGGEGCCASQFSDAVTANYSARTGQVFGEIGYGMTFGNAAAEPFAGLAWVGLNNGGFTEASGAAALTAASRYFDATLTTLGLRAATVLGLNDGTVNVHGTLGWRHAFGDVTPTMALAFASNGLPFTIGGVPIAENSLLVDAGFDIDVATNSKLAIGYSGQLAADAQDHAVLGNLLIQF